MASTLRAKLSKRHASSDLKNTATDDEDSSGSTSSEDLRSKLITKKDEQPIARDDHSSTPPPERKLRSHTVTSSSTSPSQSLLFRYKNRAAAKQVMIESPLKAAKAAAECTPSRDAAFSEEFDVDQSPTSPESVNEPCTPEKEMPKETKVFDGVEFEMIRKKQASEGPLDTTNLHQRRQSRSQTRRQQRADSHIEPEASDETHRLTIRKIRDIQRTPSPTVDQDKSHPDNPNLVTSTAMDSPQNQPMPSPPTVGDYEKISVPLSQLPISPRSTTAIPKLSSYRRSQQAKAARDDIPPVAVIPPIFNSTVPAGYLWISSLGSSSQPSEPWGWLKKWTCCQCAELDPFERGQPAQTMVEQKICSRIECGHERCPLGCRILRDHKYDGPGVFSQ